MAGVVAAYETGSFYECGDGGLVGGGLRLLLLSSLSWSEVVA